MNLEQKGVIKMTNLNLDRDEAIVLESEEILRLKQDDDYDELDHVVLTNKKLYGSYEKSNGLFKKALRNFAFGLCLILK